MTDYPEHLRGFDYVGRYRYSLTFCTFERHPHFDRGDAVLLVWTQILRAAREFRMEVIAYCFMPDHVHLIVEGKEEDSDLKRFIKQAKQYSGYHFSQGNQGRTLWQRYSFEHVIRDHESTQRHVRYVLENPVRKGMVQDPREYAFIGSTLYSVPELLEFAYSAGVAEYEAG